MTYQSNVTPIRPQPTICATCGRAGHAANRCPAASCTLCGEPGHHASSCPNRPGDAIAVELRDAA